MLLGIAALLLAQAACVQAAHDRPSVDRRGPSTGGEGTARTPEEAGAGVLQTALGWWHTYSNKMTEERSEPRDMDSWIASMLKPNERIECSAAGSSIRSWSTSCSSLAESESARSELAAALTVCEIRGVSSLDVPRECSDWLESAGRSSGTMSSGPCVA